jgi:hypothetical protein
MGKKEHEHYTEITGRDNQGKWSVSVSKKADSFTDHKIQIRFRCSDDDNSDYINCSREQLIDLRDAISGVID